MAILKPFKGLRPPKAIAHLVAARPYDVLNSVEARKEAEGNPYSLLHITKPEIDLPWEPMNMHLKCMRRQLKISANSGKMDGWSQTIRNYSTFMLRRWKVEPSTELWVVQVWMITSMV